jgi:PhnB protein
MAVRAIPEGFHSVTPYMTIQGVAKLIDFLKQAFEAEEIERMTGPNGAVGHAQLRIGDSMVMMGEAASPEKAMPCAMYLYVNDTDASYKRAIAAGASSIMAPADQFYGDRNAGVKDPSGNFWWIATHVEDVAPEELARRAEVYMKNQQAQQRGA